MNIKIRAILTTVKTIIINILIVVLLFATCAGVSYVFEKIGVFKLMNYIKEYVLIGVGIMLVVALVTTVVKEIYSSYLNNLNDIKNKEEK